MAKFKTIENQCISGETFYSNQMAGSNRKAYNTASTVTFRILTTADGTYVT